MLTKREERGIYIGALALFLLALIGLPLLILLSGVHEAILNASHAIELYANTYPTLSIISFVAIAAFLAMASFIGILPLVPSAIFIWGEFGTFLLILLGWLIGDVLMYYIGRYTFSKKIVGTSFYARVKSWEKRVSNKTEFVTILLLRLALPSETLGYVLGLIRYDLVKYFTVTLLAELPFAWATVYTADAFIEKDITVVIVITALFAALIIGATMVIRKNHQKT